MQKQFFGKYLVIVALSFFLTLILAFISANGNFPLGEDLAGGTQVVYKLDDAETQARIRRLQEKLRNAPASMPKKDREELEKDLAGATGSLTQSRGNVADIIAKRADPTGTKSVRIEMIDNNNKMRVSMPSASPVLVREVVRRIMTQGRLSIHFVVRENGTSGYQGSVLYDKLYKAIEAKAKQVFPGQTVQEAFEQPKLPESKTATAMVAYHAEVFDWETKWMEVMRLVNRELFEAEGKLRFYVDYRAQSQYGKSKLEMSRSDAWKSDMLIVESKAEVRGSDIASAMHSSLGEKGPEVNITFTAEGARVFGALTTRLCQEPYKQGEERMAIVLDGWVRSAPTIQEPILGGGCRISGAMDAAEAQRVAGVLNAGSLAFQLVEESRSTTGPTLGHESILQGMWAVALGALLVVSFMLLYYRRAGTIACMALFFNLVMLLGLMCFIKATLTLPGIAGILLTVGMAVDANVLIYERIREEMAKGRTVRAAVEQGFDRAFVTIVDSNLTTLIIGIVLYYVGSGPVKGFAMTLSLGILTSLFAGIFVTRTLIETYILRNTPGGGRGQMLAYLVCHFLAALYFATSANSEVGLAIGDKTWMADAVFAAAIALVGVGGYIYVLKSSDEGKSQRFMTVALVTTGLLASLTFFLYMGPEVQTGSVHLGERTIRMVDPLSFQNAGELQLIRILLMVGAPVAFILVAAVSQVYSRGDWTGLTMANWFAFKREFDVMSLRKTFIPLSIVLNIAGVALFIAMQGRIYDTDFTGGTELVINTKKQMSVEDVRKNLSGLHNKILAQVEGKQAELKAVIADIPGGMEDEFDAGHWLTGKQPTAEEQARAPKLYLPMELNQATLNKFNTKYKLTEQLVVLQEELPRIQGEEFRAVAAGTSGQSFQINTQINSALLQAMFEQAVKDELQPVLQDESMTVDGNTIRFRFVEYEHDRHREPGQDVQVLRDLNEAVNEVVLSYAHQPEAQAALQKLTLPAAIQEINAADARTEWVAVLSAPNFPLTGGDPAVAKDFAPYARQIIEHFEKKNGAQLRAASNWRESLTVVDSSISTGTKVSALVALVLSMAAICLYVWIRFDFIFGYGLGAVLSLLHDVAVTLLAFCLASMVLDVKISMDVVAAFLTLVGYSINDTIVIFDRIREERRAHRTRDIFRVMNDSINRTLSRTILTSGTTMLAVLALLILGGPTLRGLSIVLVVGIVTGTYSTIYVASPFVYWWINRKGGKGELEHTNLLAGSGQK